MSRNERQLVMRAQSGSHISGPRKCPAQWVATGSRRAIGDRAKSFFLSGFLASLIALSISPSWSAQDPFSRLVGATKKDRALNANVVQRYVTTNEDRIFLFEENGVEARIRFLCRDSDQRFECGLDDDYPAEEIYRLTVNRAPRGDVIYRDENGDTVLRITPYGGATVRWPGAAQESAAVKSFGQDAPLSLTPTPLAAVEERVLRASVLLSAQIGAPIYVDIGKPAYGAGLDRASEAAVLGDALASAAKAVAVVADDPTGAKVISLRVNRIVLTPAEAPSVSLNGKVLTVGYAATRGINGRLSSTAIAAYLEEQL